MSHVHWDDIIYMFSQTRIVEALQSKNLQFFFFFDKIWNREISDYSKKNYQNSDPFLTPDRGKTLESPKYDVFWQNEPFVC